jgi:hypothetical protein
MSSVVPASQRRGAAKRHAASSRSFSAIGRAPTETTRLGCLAQRRLDAASHHRLLRRCGDEHCSEPSAVGSQWFSVVSVRPTAWSRVLQCPHSPTVTSAPPAAGSHPSSSTSSASKTNARTSSMPRHYSTAACKPRRDGGGPPPPDRRIRSAVLGRLERCLGLRNRVGAGRVCARQCRAVRRSGRERRTRV